MKKLFIMLAVSISSFAFASANPVNVNYKILESFKSDFALAADIKWTPVENAGLYQVNFKYNNDDLIAVYTEEGELLGTARYINKQSLPIMVAKELNTKYSDYIVRTVIERSASGETSYFITLENAKSSLILESKSSGQLSVYKKTKSPVIISE